MRFGLSELNQPPYFIIMFTLTNIKESDEI